MSWPKPPTSLHNSCSVIYENILYSFTPEAFLSLSLEEGAKWKKLEMGERVSGAGEAFTEAAFQVEERELGLWRKRGAVGKLHNIVRFVRASPQRRELMKSLACDQNDQDGYQLFEEERAAIDLELLQNNETRWKSTFLMIQSAIRKREHVNYFVAYLETKASEPRQRVPYPTSAFTTGLASVGGDTESTQTGRNAATVIVCR
ncbi:hypothetical protein Focb16_v004363 [Fusarium oxysporum f. sp. cubense]|uniref:Uncharacterized protein n=1 Tax=Fusarium oxysporum f. sp. cubense TaxID=61366 RepID=A0A559KRL2_FUSOC|nr:hypothetical protein Focb16_v004363 [Fusarium oxysporum f. sp. cubense]